MQTYRQLKEEMVYKTLLIWKMAIASAVSWEIAKFFGSHHPYLAPSTVIVCLQTTINRSLLYSIHRVTGTVIGIIVSELLLPYLEVSVWTLGIIILAAGFIAKTLRLDESTIHQAALAVVLIFVVGHQSGDYPFDRFRNTLIGALTACAFHMFFFPPNFVKQAEKSFQHLTEKMTEAITKVSTWVQTGLDQQYGNILGKEIGEVLIELHHTNNIVQDALDSLKFNFIANKSKGKLEDLKLHIEFLSEGYAYLANVIEIFQNWSKKGTITTSEQSAWAGQLTALIPYFQPGTETKPALPDEILMVHISPELEKEQFQVSLYQETKSLLAKY